MGRVVLRAEDGPTPVRLAATSVAEIVDHFNSLVEDGHDPEKITIEGVLS